MKQFNYTAVDTDGIPQEGTLQALNKQQAVNTLKLKNFIVTKLEEKSTLSVSSFFTKLKGVPKHEIILFTRQLGTMIGAGLPISQAIRILGNQTSNQYFAQIIAGVNQQIDGGSSLHDALATNEKVFGRLYLSLIKAGESSGNLEEMLNRLATTLETDDAFRGKVKGAMIYPIVILVVMLGVVLVMFIFVIPQLAKLFEDMHADLPFMTQLMINASKFVAGIGGIISAAVVVGLVILFKRLMKIPEVSIKVSKFILKLPVFGQLSMEIQLTSFTRTLSMLVTSGIPLLDALDISKETLSNVMFRNAVKEARTQVEKGKPLADAFRRYKEFPPLLSGMVAVGEQTGKVDEVLMKISHYFEEQASQKTENLATAIEPIVMVVLGVMVGFLVVSLIMPIYSLTSQF